jgi:hypothetical protein
VASFSKNNLENKFSLRVFIDGIFSSDGNFACVVGGVLCLV